MNRTFRSSYHSFAPLVAALISAAIYPVAQHTRDQWANAGTSRIGDQSFDALVGPILNMFNFSGSPAPQVFLDPDTGLVASGQ